MKQQQKKFTPVKQESSKTGKMFHQDEMHWLQSCLFVDDYDHVQRLQIMSLLLILKPHPQLTETSKMQLLTVNNQFKFSVLDI